jgi:hypothetical protein
LLIEDYRPKEMAVAITAVPQVLRGRVEDVVPQDFPVLRLVPNICTLIRRHHKLNASIEQVVDGLSGGWLQDAKANVRREARKPENKAVGLTARLPKSQDSEHPESEH